MAIRYARKHSNEWTIALQTITLANSSVLATLLLLHVLAAEADSVITNDILQHSQVPSASDNT